MRFPFYLRLALHVCVSFLNILLALGFVFFFQCVFSFNIFYLFIYFNLRFLLQLCLSVPGHHRFRSWVVLRKLYCDIRQEVDFKAACYTGN